jgi:hypothetical protein
MIVQRWEGELKCTYVLHKARRLYEDSTTQQQAPGAPVPSYLRSRATDGLPMPQLDLKGVEARDDAVAYLDTSLMVTQGVQGRRMTRAKRKQVAEQQEEERVAMLEYAVKGLANELYIELLEAFHK